MRDALTLPAERVTKLTPETVTAYLTSHGWTEKSRAPDHSVVFGCPGPDGETWETWMPLRTSFQDYAHRVADMVITVAEVENRKAWEMLDILEDFQACGPTRLPPSYFALVRKFPLVYPQSQEHRNAASSVYMRLTKKEKLDHGEHAYLVALETLIECWENSDNGDDDDDYDPANDHFSG